MKRIYEFSNTDTANGIVNAYSLRLEIRASAVEHFIDVIVLGGVQIQCSFSEALTETQEATLQGIVTNHTGATADVDDINVNKREGVIREITKMALLHPALDDLDTEEYLVELDNYFNCYKRSGKKTVITNKIMADTLDSAHPRHAFLNTIVDTDGHKTFEFLIGSLV